MQSQRCNLPIGPATSLPTLVTTLLLLLLLLGDGSISRNRRSRGPRPAYAHLKASTHGPRPATEHVSPSASIVCTLHTVPAITRTWKNAMVPAYGKAFGTKRAITKDTSS
ncbi:hypothetical protein E4U54_005954, partial [Claviceps lovelessii]